MPQKFTAYQKRLFAFLSVATFFEGYDFFAISQLLPSIRETYGLDARHGTWLERYGNLQLSLHTGAAGGLTGKIIAFATCLALVLQIISGCILWWRRPAAQAG